MNKKKLQGISFVVAVSFLALGIEWFKSERHLNSIREEEQQKRFERIHADLDEVAVAIEAISLPEEAAPSIKQEKVSSKVKTQNKSCSERAQTYQERYLRTNRINDLICFQKALERELTNPQQFHCPKSAQHYQDQYLKTNNSSDFVCFNKALRKEL